MVFYNRMDITDRTQFSSCVFESFASGSADLLRASIADPGGVWIRQPPEPGDIFSVTAPGVDTGDLFVFSSRRVGRNTNILATAMPPGMKDPRTESWQTVRLHEIIQKIASRNGLIASIDNIPNQLYPYMIQSRQSDASFLYDLLTAESCSMRVHDGCVIVRYEPAMETAAPTEDVTFSDQDVLAVIDRRPEMFAKCELTCGGLTASFEDAFAVTNRVLQRDGDPLIASDKVTVSRFARGILRSVNKRALSGSVRITGSAKNIEPGDVIGLQLPGSSQWSGSALVESMRHDLCRLQTVAKWRRLILEGY